VLVTVGVNEIVGVKVTVRVGVFVFTGVLVVVACEQPLTTSAALPVLLSSLLSGTPFDGSTVTTLVIGEVTTHGLSTSTTTLIVALLPPRIVAPVHDTI
jgi:hypothetical protein